MKGIIYKATNLTNGEKIYIGQTSHTLNWRKNKHLRSAFEEGKVFEEGSFYHDIQKGDVFIWEQIDTVDNDEELTEKEKYWTDFYDAYRPNGYCSHKFVNGGRKEQSGIPKSAEHKRLISEGAKKAQRERFKEQHEAMLQRQEQHKKEVIERRVQRHIKYLEKLEQQRLEAKIRRNDPVYQEQLKTRHQEIGRIYLTPEARARSHASRKGKPMSEEGKRNIQIGSAQLDEQTVLDILRYLNYGHSMNQTAKRFDVSKSVVCGIKTGKKYAWIPRP